MTTEPAAVGVILPRARIVVAEDDPELRRRFVDALRKDGHEVVPAAGGLELLDVLERSRGTPGEPHLVVSDLRMPGMSGFEVLARLRASGSRIPAVFVTAFADDESLVRARELGTTAVIRKPIGLDELRAVVRWVLRAASPPPDPTASHGG